MQAKRDILIHILPEDVTSGIQANPNKCPITRAIKRVLPDAKQVLTYCTHIIIDGNKYLLPDDISERIYLYDNNIKNLSPFEFKIKIK